MHYRPPSDLLAGRSILITGASGGLGHAAALSYADHGARTILCGRNADKLEALCATILERDGLEPDLAILDLAVSGEQQMLNLHDAIATNHGRLDGLLHSAAAVGPLVPLEHYPAVEFAMTMHVNLTGAFRLTQALHPLLTAAPDASVIFTSAAVGRHPKANWGAYAIGKCALEALSSIWADEQRNLSAVRYNSLDPGMARTRLRHLTHPGQNPAHLPLPSELMPLYLYLAGPDSIGITGQAFDARTWCDAPTARQAERSG